MQGSVANPNDPYRKIERKHTVSEKWNKVDPPFDTSLEGFAMTFADMDFPLSADIQAGMIKELSHPDLSVGYAIGDQAWKDTIADWVLEESGVSINKDMLTECAGIFQFISVCVDMFVGDKEAYVVLTPLCDVLIAHSEFAGKRIIESRLVVKNGRFQINYEELESILSKEQVKMLLFVNPHSPTGRVWQVEELEKIVGIMERTGKTVLSDEIYSSISYKPFTTLLKYADRLKDQLIVGSSSSKSFNVSGSACGYGVMPNTKILRRYEDVEMFKYTTFPAFFSIMTLKACYKYGKKWLKQTKLYLQQNLALLKKTFDEKFPHLPIYIPDAAYAVLVDFSYYGLTSEVVESIVRKHNMVLSSMRAFFYPNGETLLFRITVGCNRDYLRRFLVRFETVVAQLESKKAKE